MDRVVVDLERDERSCVECGFNEARPQEAGPSEVPTRVTRAASRRVETQAEVVQLLDPTAAQEDDKGSD